MNSENTESGFAPADMATAHADGYRSCLQHLARFTSSTPVALLSAERARQLEVEEHAPADDDRYQHDELACAAAVYALPPSARTVRHGLVDGWPWSRDSWKPGDETVAGRIRDLVKAGALILAEIERLQRSAGITPAPLDTQADLPFPFDGEVRWILGLICFQCVHFAAHLRSEGQIIETRAEAEQAATLYWMLQLYFKHGADWRDVAKRSIERGAAAR